MIYQLKVTLKDISPPVWRRLLVHADITFAQLHEILQIAFQWEDIHLHQFVVRKIPQDKAVKHRRMMVPVYGKPEIFIGIPDRDGWGPPCLHERREKLSDYRLMLTGGQPVLRIADGSANPVVQTGSVLLRGGWLWITFLPVLHYPQPPQFTTVVFPTLSP